MILSISDNGVGMITTEVQSFKGNGLNNMKDRSALLGGKLEIRGKSGKGTEIYLEIKNFADGKD